MILKLMGLVKVFLINNEYYSFSKDFKNSPSKTM